MAEAPASAVVPVDAQNTPITAGQLAAAIAAAETRVQAQCLAIMTQVVEGIDTGGGKGDSGGSGVTADATALSPAPFTVRWDFDDKCWMMDLPKGSVTLDGEDITPEDVVGLSEGTWYLNITYPKGGKSSSTDKSAKIEKDKDSKADLSIPIVELDEDQVVMQYLTGALHLTRGGGTGVQLFEPEYDDGVLTGNVLRPYIMAGRKVLEAYGYIGDGTWGVMVAHNGEAIQAEIVPIDDPVQDNSDPEYTIVPLYTIEDGKITEDFRGMTAVPLYDPLDDK